MMAHDQVAKQKARAPRETVPCIVELEATHDHFHAHVDLLGVLVDAGDSVLLRQAPSRLAFGERRSYSSVAEIEHAGIIKRAWTKLVGRFGFQELYDVGFEG